MGEGFSTDVEFETVRVRASAWGTDADGHAILTVRKHGEIKRYQYTIAQVLLPSPLLLLYTASAAVLCHWQ